MNHYILVLYYSRHGTTAQMAHHVARGVEQITNMEAIVRTVPAVSANCESVSPSIPSQGAVYCSVDELKKCSGLALGSPSRFGGMAAPLKYFLEQTGDLWSSGALIDKPACVFTTSSSRHGGQEATLLNMMIPLLHHGMVISGLPYSEPGLMNSNSDGTPYGPSHTTGINNELPLDTPDAKMCQATGKRLAKIALKLSV